MVKVRTSQIPEESGKPKHIPNSPYVGTAEPDDDYGSTDAYDVNKPVPVGDTEEQKVVRMMLHIPEFGFAINVYDICTIDKDFRLYESVNGTGDIIPQYGIVFNKNIEGMHAKRKDIEFWCNSEEVRDQRYRRIMKALDKIGFKFLNV